MHTASVVPKRHIILGPPKPNLEFNAFRMIEQHFQNHTTVGAAGWACSNVLKSYTDRWPGRIIELLFIKASSNKCCQFGS